MCIKDTSKCIWSFSFTLFIVRRQNFPSLYCCKIIISQHRLRKRKHMWVCAHHAWTPLNMLIIALTMILLFAHHGMAWTRGYLLKKWNLDFLPSKKIDWPYHFWSTLKENHGPLFGDHLWGDNPLLPLNAKFTVDFS